MKLELWEKYDIIYGLFWYISEMEEECYRNIKIIEHNGKLNFGKENEVVRHNGL